MSRKSQHRFVSTLILLVASFFVLSPHPLHTLQKAKTTLSTQDAQAANAYFLRAYGGTGAETIYGMSATSDDGFVTVGATTSSAVDGYDAMVMKFDSTGTLSWSKTYDNDANSYSESGYDIVQTSDGGYAMISTGQSSVYAHIMLYKLDSTGAITWVKAYGQFATSKFTNPGFLQQTSDGGYIIGGYTSAFGANGSDVFLLKTDSLGNREWAKRYGTTGTDNLRDIRQTSDGGYIFGIFSQSYGDGNTGIVMKLTSTGATSWTRLLEGIGGEYIESIVETSDGGFAVGGGTNSYGEGSLDLFVTKLTSSGVVSWTKVIGWSGYDNLEWMEESSDGGLIAVGTTQSVGAGGSDILITKLTSDGTFSWAKLIGNTGADTPKMLIENANGDFIIGGYSGSYGAGSNDAVIIKVDSSGNISGCSEESDVTPTVSSVSMTNATQSVTTANITANPATMSFTAASYSPTTTEQCYVEPAIPEETVLTINVQPSFSVNISNANLDLGGFSSSIVNGGTIDVAVTSNISDGYSLYIDDTSNSGLSSPGHTIPMTTGTLVAGTEGAGWSIDSAGTNLANNGGTCPGNNAVTDIGTTPFELVSTLAPSSDSYTLCFAVATNILTPSGSYSHDAEITYIPHY